VITIPVCLAAWSVPAKRPKLFWMLWLLNLLLFCTFFAPPLVNTLNEQCASEFDEQASTRWTVYSVWSTIWPILLAVLVLCFGLHTRRMTLISFRKRIHAIEGDLAGRLGDGSLLLLRVAWLLERPADWVLQRQQDLPAEAFWSPADAVCLLEREKVAALSYKWQGPFNSSEGGGDHPDGSRFHLDAVLAYFRVGKHAQQRPALMWDFCSVPQHHPITGEKRNEAETSIFRSGLSVMTNAYASPRVLVLQHRRILPELELELESFGGKPPIDRLDLIPYEGRYCRSGWCTSESACALLMTAGGGHAYELGVGNARVAPGQLPSVEHMEALFHDETTRFVGKADRDAVGAAYLKLRRDLEAYDEAHSPAIVHFADTLMTGQTHGDDGLLRVIFYVFLLVPTSWIILTIVKMTGESVGGIFRSTWTAALVIRVHLIVVFPFGLLVATILHDVFDALAGRFGVTEILSNIVWIGSAIFSVAVATFPSRIVRAHLARTFGYRSYDSPEYDFNRSLVSPPFRKRTPPRSAASCAALDV